jgi:hypothetical protein
MASTARRSRRRKPEGAHEIQVEADFSKGMIRDAPRPSIPNGGVYDSADFLLHQPGIAIKRGGTAYAGPALGGDSYAKALVHAEFPAGGQLIAISDANNIYKVTAGTTTDLAGSDPTGGVVDRPKLRVGGGKSLLVIPQANGTSAPIKYDGSAAPAALGGTPAPGKFVAIYKTRVVLGNRSGNENRLHFSPTPDIEATWDTANSWIDCDYPITGLAALQNALLIFSAGHTERIIGSTPPPGSDMDRSLIGDIGCTDARSIVVQEGNVLFANPRGVYLTNGAGFASLTTEGSIESYWQSLFAGYDPSTWVISAGVFRGFYLVSILDNTGALKAALMCYVPRRAWMPHTNIRAMMFAAAVGASEELYYADRASARVIGISGMFSPSAANKNDADGTPVTPRLETRMLGHGPGLKHFGFGRLSYDMRDAATDNPELVVSVAPGVEGTTFAAVAESPLGENTDEERKRFTIAKQSQGATVRLQQVNASSKTEIYALEYEERPFALQIGGQ